MSNKAKILITSVGGIGVQSLLSDWRTIYKDTYSFVGVDASQILIPANGLAVLRQVPLANAQNYTHTVVDICKDERPDFILPLSDDEVISLASNTKLIPNTIKLLTPELKASKICVDKAELNQYLFERDVAVPITVVLEQGKIEEQIFQMQKEFKTLAIKPRNGRGSRGFYLLEDCENRFNQAFFSRNSNSMSIDQLKELCELGEPEKLILMQYLSGSDFNIDVLCWQGELIHCVIQKRLAPKHGPIQQGEIVYDHNIENQVQKAVKALNISGIINVEAAYPLHGDSGTPCIYEINPRPSAAINFSEMAEVPMLRDYVNLVEGKTVKPKKAKKLYLQRYWQNNYNPVGADN